VNAGLRQAVQTLDRRFLLDHPWQAAQQVETLEPTTVAEELADQSAGTLVPLFRRLAPTSAGRVLERLPRATASSLLAELLPTEAVAILGTLDPDAVKPLVAGLDPDIGKEFEELMSYPEDSAGRLMDTRVHAFRRTISARQALDSLRLSPSRTARSLFLIDDDNRLAAKVAIQDVAVADPDAALAGLAAPIVSSVHPLTPRDDVVEAVERHRLADLPVTDLDGRLVGVIYHSSLIQAIQEDLSADIQMMSGASPDERALSPPWFSVKKRLPWLQINLLTAFLAAAVVGLFESTIAKYTALAVLLPVVAGQSGNSGAQALAVTMRGLVLREITPRQWFAVTVKEAGVGLVNGIAVAITCGIGVYFWSRSSGLVLVIMVSMVLAMVIAGLAGAIVPIVLKRVGLDPAQSSSIILTTVTDVAGFFSFLGIATMLSGMLDR
jgi:magnesium transporter